MEEKAVSIIMLCSNNNYIHMCIDALSNQLTKNDELIIVDDHSDCEFLKRLSSYELSNKIKLYHTPKYGNRAYNRNFGVSYAQNDILIFLDGDIVLSSNAILNIKKFYTYEGHAAGIGLMHATRYSPMHLRLLSGIPDFNNMIATEFGRKQIKENVLFKDAREEKLLSAKKNDFFWIYFYSGFCSVKKEIFQKIGGFDTNFSGWGAEDVDLGYRISLYDTIGVIENCYGIHIPHPRNMLKIEYNNYHNLRYMFRKYLNWQLEVLVHFKGNLEIFETFQTIISQMQLLMLNDLEKTCKSDILYIESISAQNPYGKISYFDFSGKLHIYETMGMVQPVNHMVNKVIITENIFIYPPEISSIILQEALNICDNVYISPSSECVRICWDRGRLFYDSPAQYC